MCCSDRIDIPPPPATPVREVADELHGREVTDPYRWLEEDDSEDTRQWTRLHNRRTREVFDQLPAYCEYQKRLGALLDTEKVGSPQIHGEHLFYLHHRPGEDQPVLCVADPDGSSSRVVVDPNSADEQGLVALDWWYPSPDGSLVAYGLSQHGNEWSTLYVVKVKSGKHLPDEIQRTRGASIAWQKGADGFYYTRYPQPGDVPEGEENYHRQVYHHRLGDDPAGDPLIFGEGRDKTEMYQLRMSDDGRHLLITVNHGWSRSDIFVRREEDGEIFPVVKGHDALFTGHITGETLYLLTNWQAPNYRILAVNLSYPALQPREVLPENEQLVLQQMVPAGSRLAVTALRDATYRLFVFDPDDGAKGKADLPERGSIYFLDADESGDRIYFSFQSFLRAPVIYRLDADDTQPQQIMCSEQPVDPDDFQIRQVFYRSKDGTQVPMFIVHRADIEPGEPRPTVLTGYGGFNISRTPAFSPAQIPWMQDGGIYALANLRGGSEYGERWHREGMMHCKQNVFDDFCAAAEYLMQKGYTTSEQLGITGRSNGGLLVGAAMTQRPELFGAVACGVPLLDMLRFHRFLIAALWTHEYGSPDDPDAFEWLYKYSPYHNVEKGEEYPPVFLFTAESDTRVHPMHARKMTALLQEATASEDPVLLRVETKAGHGAGKPLSKMITDQAQVWTFFDWQLR